MVIQPQRDNENNPSLAYLEGGSGKTHMNITLLYYTHERTRCLRS